MITLFKLMSVLPLALLQGLGWLLGWLTYALSPLYRRRLRANAAQAGVAPRLWRRSVGEAGKLVTELPRLWLGRPVPLFWDGREQVQAALNLGRGIVFLTPHLGCFEVAARAYAQAFGQVKPITVLFRPARQRWLREVVATARTGPGLQAAPTTLVGVKLLLKALKDGAAVGLLPDQVPPRGLGVMAPFFGRDAYTMTLSARLVAQTGATVLLAWGERLPWGRGFVVHVRPMDAPLPADVQQAATAINRAMETLVLACPTQYLWGYARYKSPRESL